MNTQRKIQRVISPLAVSDGAGVKLNRLIATPTLDYLDPVFTARPFRFGKF